MILKSYENKWERAFGEPIDFSKLKDGFINAETIKIVGTAQLYKLWIRSSLGDIPVKNISQMSGSIYIRPNVALKFIDNIIIYKIENINNFNFERRRNFNNSSTQTGNRNVIDYNKPDFLVNTGEDYYEFNTSGSLLKRINTSDSRLYKPTTYENTYDLNGDLLTERIHNTLNTYSRRIDDLDPSKTYVTIERHNIPSNRKYIIEQIYHGNRCMSTKSINENSEYFYKDGGNRYLEKWLDTEEDDNGELTQLPNYYKWEYDDDREVIEEIIEENNQVITKTTTDFQIVNQFMNPSRRNKMIWKKETHTIVTDNGRVTNDTFIRERALTNSKEFWIECHVQNGSRGNETVFSIDLK